MDKIITVKRQQGKGPGDFRYVVSALFPQATPQELCFLLSLQLLSSWLGSLITHNTTGITSFDKEIFLLGHSKQVEKHFLPLTHCVGKWTNQVMTHE